MSKSEFTALEVHVLSTLRFLIQPVTMLEAVSVLLHFIPNDALQAKLAVHHTTESTMQRHDDDEALVAQLRRRLQRESATEDLRMMEEWKRLRTFCNFLCDVVVRADIAASAIEDSPTSGPGVSGATGVSAMSLHTGDEDGDDWTSTLSLMQLPPMEVALAILTVAVEQLHLPLPAPLVDLLPLEYQARLEASAVRQHAASYFVSQPTTWMTQESESNYFILTQFAQLVKRRRARRAAAFLDSRESEDAEATASVASLDISPAPRGGHGSTEGGSMPPRSYGQLRSSRPMEDSLNDDDALQGFDEENEPRRSQEWSQRLALVVLYKVEAMHHHMRDDCPSLLLKRYHSMFRSAS